MNIVKTDITGIGDPFVLYHEGFYYMYATSASEGFNVWYGTDLKNLSLHGLCYYAPDSFGINCFWAPEVIRRYDGKFVMHFSARDKESKGLRIGVAVADSPLGPFIDVYNKPMFDYGYSTIDATCFTDDDGNSYLYYSRDCSDNIVGGIHMSRIYGVKLDKSLTRVISDPVLLLEPVKPWETKLYTAPLASLLDEWIHKDLREYYLWNEAPYVVKRDGIYYMTYSANCFDSRYYGIGLALGKSPLGEFVKYDEPICQLIEGDTCGVGHSMFFRDDERDYIAYHCHTDATRPSGDRRFCYSEVEIGDGKIIIK